MDVNLAIFASGNGTNAENIAKYFANHKNIKIPLIISNNPTAFVLERAKKLGIKTFIINSKSENVLLEVLNQNNVDFIVLAGYLKLISQKITQNYLQKILNIHPALLPHFGGKGMYGNYVHEAVIKSNCKESGITIHYVNEKYDDGQIVFQAKCSIDNNETIESLAKKIHFLEHQYYPVIIEETIKKQFNL